MHETNDSSATNYIDQIMDTIFLLCTNDGLHLQSPEVSDFRKSSSKRPYEFENISYMQHNICIEK